MNILEQLRRARKGLIGSSVISATVHMHPAEIQELLDSGDEEVTHYRSEQGKICFDYADLHWNGILKDTLPIGSPEIIIETRPLGGWSDNT